ncbi:IclR family transcriptional regulator [Frigidibacter sp. MR17.14]|uniref:IclR family transcriptional regulator n=1 Tax=Frigidibacter sp. MR17.14 TaxID=3126509 RepID=UPI003013075E
MKHAPPPLPEPAASGAQAVERALSLLSLVGRGGARGAGLSELVAAAGLPKATTRRLLLALIGAGLVEQDEISRRYHLGQEAFVLGTLASRRHGVLEQAADGLRRLSAATQDTSFISVRHGDYVMCLHREEGSHPVRTHALQTGDQHPLGVGAGSMAMLSALPEDEREAVIARLAPLYARYPGYSAEIVREDARIAADRGWALNPGRVVASSWGVGVAVTYPDGRLAAALSVAAIDSRMTPDRQPEIAALLTAEAESLRKRLGRAPAPHTPARSAG